MPRTEIWMWRWRMHFPRRKKRNQKKECGKLTQQQTARAMPIRPRRQARAKVLQQTILRVRVLTAPAKTRIQPLPPPRTRPAPQPLQDHLKSAKLRHKQLQTTCTAKLTRQHRLQLHHQLSRAQGEALLRQQRMLAQDTRKPTCSALRNVVGYRRTVRW